MTHSLKIAQLITGSENMGGAQAHVRDLIAGLRSHGHECTVLCGPPDGSFCAQLRDRNISVRIISAFHKRLSPTQDGQALFSLVQALAAIRPDIVAAHTAKAAFLGRVAAGILRVPCVVTPHGVSIIDRNTGKTRASFLSLERMAGHFTDKIIVVSEHEWRLAKDAKLVASQKLALVHNGIPDMPRIADPAREPAVITMIARFNPPKDYETLVKALAKLRDIGSWSARFVGAGPGMARVRALASHLNVGERVDFTGEHPDAAAVLAASQIFVLSSRMEAFPISILEAMRAGLPVVASDVGGTSEAVEQGSTGLLFPAGDEDALAKCIQCLLWDRASRQAMGAKGRLRYLNRFTDTTMVNRTLAVYSEALASAASRGCRPPLARASA